MEFAEYMKSMAQCKTAVTHIKVGKQINMWLIFWQVKGMLFFITALYLSKAFWIPHFCHAAFVSTFTRMIGMNMVYFYSHIS